MFERPMLLLFSRFQQRSAVSPPCVRLRRAGIPGRWWQVEPVRLRDLPRWKPGDCLRHDRPQGVGISRHRLDVFGLQKLRWTGSVEHNRGHKIPPKQPELHRQQEDCHLGMVVRRVLVVVSPCSRCRRSIQMRSFGCPCCRLEALRYLLHCK